MGGLSLVLTLSMLLGSTVFAAEYTAADGSIGYGDATTATGFEYNSKIDQKGHVICVGDIIEGGTSVFGTALNSESHFIGNRHYAEGTINIDGSKQFSLNTDSYWGMKLPEGKRYRVDSITTQNGPCVANDGTCGKLLTEYTLNLVTLLDSTPGSNQSSESKKSDSSDSKGSVAPHVHKMEWSTVSEASASADGKEVYMCSECGYTDAEKTIAHGAYPFFIHETKNKIEKAAQNSTVVIDSRIWNAFPKSTMEAIAARPDLTIDFKLYYKNEPMEVLIQPGQTIDTSTDYYGSLKLAELYGSVNK